MTKRDKKRRWGIVAQVFFWLAWVLWMAIFVAATIYSALSVIGVIVLGLALADAALGGILYATKRDKLRKIHGRVNLALFILLLVVGAILIFWPDRGTWDTYTFKDELAAIEAKRTVPDAENAAILYESLLGPIDPDANECEFFLDQCPVFRGPWRQAEYPRVSQYLEANADLLEELVVICRSQKCRFEVPAQYLADSSQRYPKLRLCARLLVAAGNRDIGEGRIDSGLEKYLSVLRMAGHCRQQPTRMGFYSGGHIEGLALGPIIKFTVVNTAGDKDLDLIAAAVDTRNNWADDWPAILAAEKVQLKNLVGHLYEVNPQGKTRFSRHLFHRYARETDLSNWDRVAMDRTLFLFLPLFVPYRPQTVGKVVDDMYDAMALSDFDWEMLEGHERHRVSEMRRLAGVRLVLAFLAPKTSDWSKFRDSYLRRVAVRRACRILIALRRHKNQRGLWPGNLDDIRDMVPADSLTDPTNEDRFVYRLTDDGFTLYSKAKNNIDEGGEYDPYDRQTGADDILIWPLRSRKPEQDNANGG
ncbi:MAG: hypothetical protein ACYTEL_23985 [Planctomycetota bacterium]|jgi:hypothetical protein